MLDSLAHPSLSCLQKSHFINFLHEFSRENELLCTGLIKTGGNGKLYLVLLTIFYISMQVCLFDLKSIQKPSGTLHRQPQQEVKG